MRKLFSILLTLALMIPMTGCAEKQNGTVFYYIRSEVQYGQADGVISSEIRDVPGHENDLSYLLVLYLEGPISQELSSPFPKGTAIQKLDIQEDGLHIVLSDVFSYLQAMDYTIACTCLAKTCFALGDYSSVTVHSGNTSLTLTPDIITLTDNSAITEPT